MFYATELGGECGELLNKCKKWYRASAGLPGSTTTASELISEAADTIICTVNLVNKLGLGDILADAIRHKYNSDSSKNSFKTRIK